jgi:transposase-like protein
MKNNYKAIDPKIKSEILSKSRVPGCSIIKLAQSYNISKATIYHWQKQEVANINITSKTINPGLYVEKAREEDRNFVELSVSDHNHHISSTPSMHQKSRLEKAHLVFKDFSIDIEGKVSSEALFRAIKILEISSC